MKSVMKHDFSKVPAANIQRSSFDRSHGYHTTFDAGYLVPIFLDEALPGDTFKLRAHTFARMATPVFPVMDNIFADVFFFAVPLRLVWDNFQRFMGEQDDPGDSTDYLIPTIESEDVTNTLTIPEGSLGDYFGLPTGVALAGQDGTDSGISALPFRAYNLIYNTWFRDQNLQNSVPVTRGDAASSLADHTLLRRGKRHDYFTSALPWTQKGPAVSLPLGTTAPVVGDGTIIQMYGVTDGSSVVRDLGNDNTIGVRLQTGLTTPTYQDLQWSNTGLEADLSAATAATINAFREAFQLQMLFEADARGGTRYIEIIRSHFGVVSDDARLQRPEFLGGGSTRVNISPVAQTSESATSPQGNLAAFGTFSHDGKGFVRSFTEHMIIMGLINVRADLTYQQGVNRMWLRQTRYDFYWPLLSHLGEQEVWSAEIYADGSANDWDVFGYQERYAEYRYKPSLITGKFRSNATGSLDAWHLSQDFSARPTLNASFIEDNPPMSRVLAVETEPQFLLDVYFDLKCARPMPMYSVPGLMARF